METKGNIFSYSLWRCDNGTYDILQDGEVIRENVPIGAILNCRDLLAALEDSVFQIERFTQIHGDRAARPCLDRARAAIAKATGGK